MNLVGPSFFIRNLPSKNQKFPSPSASQLTNFHRLLALPLMFNCFTTSTRNAKILPTFLCLFHPPWIVKLKEPSDKTCKKKGKRELEMNNILLGKCVCCFTERESHYKIITQNRRNIKKFFGKKVEVEVRFGIGKSIISLSNEDS
jgi:hypothetical protein